MKIGIDIDEVIADFFPALLKYYNEKYHRADKPEDFKEFKWWPIWGISKEEAIKRVNEFHESHKLEEVYPIPGAVEAIDKISVDNSLFLITSRPKQYQGKADSWIKHHLKREMKIIHSGDFHKGQASTKADICKELGIQIMLEDAPDTALDCAEKNIKVILFDYHWNKKVRHKNITRVKNWKEALKEIEK